MGQVATEHLESRILLAAVLPGPIFQVNSYAQGNQGAEDVAMDASGAFVVVWQSPGQDGSGQAIVARRFTASGMGLGPEFVVNGFVAGDQTQPSIAMAPNGAFVVAWYGVGPEATVGIYARRFDAAGNPLGDQFRVNTTTPVAGFNRVNGGQPDVAIDADGDFVVAWTSYTEDANSFDVMVRRFNAVGVPQGGEFQVNIYTTSSQQSPAVAMDADGDFAIVWESFGQDGSDWGVYARSFGALGVPRGGEFRVSTTTENTQWEPAIGMDAAGNFLIAWAGRVEDDRAPTLPSDTTSFDVFARRYDAIGVPVGVEFQVNNEVTVDDQLAPSVSMTPGGQFLIAWAGVNPETLSKFRLYRPYGQRFDASGNPVSAEFEIGFDRHAYDATVALAPDGGLVATFELLEVYAQVFRERAEVVVTGLGPGGEPRVRLFEGSTIQPRLDWNAYDPAFSGGVNVATGDFTGDGTPDVVTGPGLGGGPHVRVFSGTDGALLWEFMAYGPDFRGGLSLAVADVNGDTVPDIITGAGLGGGPHVRVFSGADRALLLEFMAYDPDFRGGVNVAAANVDGQNHLLPEIITGPGPGGGPHVRIFKVHLDQGTVTAQYNFWAFDPAFPGGVHLAAADLGRTDFAQIVAGAGPGGGPHVRVFNVVGVQHDGPLGSFYAYDPHFPGGVRVALADLNEDGVRDVITAAGLGGGPHVRAFDVRTGGLLPGSFGNWMAYDPALRTGLSAAASGSLGGPSLRAAGGPAAPAVPPPRLTEPGLGRNVDAALTRFETAGLGGELLRRLQSVEFVLADLAGALLGQATASRITIDVDAAGYGWFIDPTPMADEEFRPLAGGELAADAAPAAGRMDLLTVVLHELGHQLGWNDLHAHPGELMFETLEAGRRRLPREDELRTAFGDALLQEALAAI